MMPALRAAGSSTLVTTLRGAVSTPRDAISMTSMGFFFACRHDKNGSATGSHAHTVDAPSHLHDVREGGISGLIQAQVGGDDGRERHVDGLGARVGLAGGGDALCDGLTAAINQR